MGKRILFYIMGISIACMGVTFILKSKAGAGPQDVVLLVLAEKTGFTFGTWVIISQGLFLLINAFLLKRRPQLESIITMIIWGIIVDFWMEIIFRNLELAQYSPTLRWGYFLLGMVLIGVGVGIYLTSNLPPMPYDGLMVAISEKYKLNLMIARTILEVVFIIMGALVGGTIGIGTIVLVLCIGSIIQFFNNIAMRIYEKPFLFFNIFK